MPRVHQDQSTRSSCPTYLHGVAPDSALSLVDPVSRTPRTEGHKRPETSCIQTQFQVPHAYNGTNAPDPDEAKLFDIIINDTRGEVRVSQNINKPWSRRLTASYVSSPSFPAVGRFPFCHNGTINKANLPACNCSKPLNRWLMPSTRYQAQAR